MTKKMKTILISVLALTTLSGGIAIADQTMKGDKRAAHFKEMVIRYDSNKDGKLTQEEITAGHSKELTDSDADKSGGLSVSEYESLWLARHKDRMTENFKRFDSNGDGNVTTEEYNARVANMMSHHNKNQDDFLTLDEMEKSREHGKGRHSKGRHGKGQHGEGRHGKGHHDEGQYGEGHHGKKHHGQNGQSDGQKN